MSGKRYPEDFKIEAIRQVTDRGYKIAEVAQRLGVTVKSMHDWISKYGSNSNQHQALTSQQEEIRKLKAELRRVTEERDILKEATLGSTGQRNTLIEFICRTCEVQCLASWSKRRLMKCSGSIDPT